MCENLGTILNYLQTSFNCLEILYIERMKFPQISFMGLQMDMNIMGKNIHSSDVRVFIIKN